MPPRPPKGYRYSFDDTRRVRLGVQRHKVRHRWVWQAGWLRRTLMVFCRRQDDPSAGSWSTQVPRGGDWGGVLEGTSLPAQVRGEDKGNAVHAVYTVHAVRARRSSFSR